MRRFKRLVKQSPDKINVETKKIITLAVAFSAVIVSLLLLSWFCCPDYPVVDDNADENDNDDSEVSESFGDNTLGGKYVADAKLLTSEGETKGTGISPAGTTPEVMFDDDFESGDFGAWTYYSDPPELTVSTEEVYEGDYAAKFDPCGWSIEDLKKSGAVSIDDDDQLHLYFFTYLDDSFKISGSTYEGEVEILSHKDFYVVKLEFTNGKTLVYLIGGMYSGGSNEAVIDIRDQITAQGDWVGIEIEDIQNDYEAQFSGEMPHSGSLRFKVRSRHGIVYLDDITLKKTPETTEGDYWAYEDERVECYYFSVDLWVEISDCINESDVWAEIKLWTTIFFGEEEVKSKTFLQEALINITVYEEWLEWTSICFNFPEDDTVYGDELTYFFDIKVEVFGQIEEGCTGAGDWISAEADEESFDSFTIIWINYDGYITIIIAGIVGSLGTVGVIGGRKLKKRSKDVEICTCLGEPDCECKL